MTPAERAAEVLNHIIKIEVENAALKGILGTLYTSPGHPLDWAAMMQPLRTDAGVRGNVEARYADTRQLLSEIGDRDPHAAALALIDGLLNCWEG